MMRQEGWQENWEDILEVWVKRNGEERGYEEMRATRRHNMFVEREEEENWRVRGGWSREEEMGVLDCVLEVVEAKEELEAMDDFRAVWRRVRETRRRERRAERARRAEEARRAENDRRRSLGIGGVL